MIQRLYCFWTHGWKNVIKKIPRYQQFRAVHKTSERIKKGKAAKDKSGVMA